MRFQREDRRAGTPGGARLVIRAKYAISFFSPFQGRELLSPIPIWFVAATMRVSSRGSMFDWDEVPGGA